MDNQGLGEFLLIIDLNFPKIFYIFFNVSKINSFKSISPRRSIPNMEKILNSTNQARVLFSRFELGHLLSDWVKQGEIVRLLFGLGQVGLVYLIKNLTWVGLGDCRPIPSLRLGPTPSWSNQKLGLSPLGFDRVKPKMDPLVGYFYFGAATVRINPRV